MDMHTHQKYSAYSINTWTFHLKESLSRQSTFTLIGPPDSLDNTGRR